MTQPFHLAQLNIARSRYDTSAPEFQTFVDLVEPVNALADRMDGFVWRLIGEGGNGSTDIKAFDDPRMVVNMSVWESIESLETFAYKTVHTKVMERKAEWFSLLESRHLVLWWVPAGHIPSLDEAKARLEHLNAHGPSADAFTFSTRFDPSGRPVVPAEADPA